jgi:predicted DsbA family dithiol-disulfide isomerase
VNYRSFQLNVNTTSHPDKNINELIANKYNKYSVSGAQSVEYFKHALEQAVLEHVASE